MVKNGALQETVALSTVLTLSLLEALHGVTRVSPKTVEIFCIYFFVTPVTPKIYPYRGIFFYYRGVVKNGVTRVTNFFLQKISTVFTLSTVT